MSLGSSAFAIGVLLLASGVAAGPARAQPTHHGAAAIHQHQAAAAVPTMPGHDAFGAVQEIVRILEDDPTTDWSNVDLAALREHLIDMNEVTLNAAAAAQPVDNGITVAVTGSGRTLDAIRRMVPAHTRELGRVPGWTAKTASLADGIRLTVSTAEPRDVARIRGLGFIGLMASGSHHQPHHLAIARGQRLH